MRCAIAWSTVLVAILLAPFARGADVIRKTESHVFESYTPTDQEFLAGQRGTRKTTIGGELVLPVTSADKLPLVIILHGSAGMWRITGDLVDRLHANGIATFGVDSFSSRGIVSTSRDQDQLGRLTMIVDAYRALDLMSRHREIDPKRIVLMGWSRGGHAALYASLQRFQRLHGPKDAAFAAYVVFYAPCNTTYREDERVGAAPIRLFHGLADDYTPAAPCRAYVKRLKTAGADVVLEEYADALHAFDWPAFNKPVVRNPNAQTTRNCVLTESDAGVVLSQSGKAFTHADPCVERGPSVGYNAAAHAAAYGTVLEFFGAQLK